MTERPQKKINILFCIEYLAYGGTEKQLIALIQGLNRERFDPHLCCLKRSVVERHRLKEASELFRRIKCKKINLDYVSLSDPRSYFQLLRLIKFVRKNDIQIIQSYFQDPTLLAVLTGKLCGVRHIVAGFRDMAFWHRGATDYKMRVVYRLCTNYIGNCEAVCQKNMSLFGLPQNKFVVIYNGVDIANQTPLMLRKETNHKGVTVGIIANLNRTVKRVDIFLRAAAYVNKRKKGIEFVVIGDGELKESLISLSRKLGISEVVTFIGRVRDVSEWLPGIDIGVISSDSEGFSNSILEFMEAGVPVVATDVGGNSEIISDRVNGFLVPPGDYRSIGDRIIELATLRQLFVDMKQNAFETVSKNYTLKYYIEKHEIYYHRLIRR